MMCRNDRIICLSDVALGHRTSHEPLLSQGNQSDEPQLLRLLLVHKQLQNRAERTS